MSKVKSVCKTCERCGQEYFTTASHAKTQKYCSRSCLYLASRNTALDKICANCGNPFRGHSETSLYCSLRCQNQSRMKRVAVTCAYCGASVLRTPYYAEVKTPFCSLECRNEYLRTLTGRNNRTWKPKAKLTCEYCKKVFEVVPSIVDKRRFCSKKCHGTWVALHQPTQATSIEIAIRKLLTDLKIPFQEQFPIGRFRCDFLVTTSSGNKIVIETDGDYWHSRPEVQARDRQKTAHILNSNYRLLRLPEHKINNDLDWCKKQILAAVKPGAWQSPLF